MAVAAIKTNRVVEIEGSRLQNGQLAAALQIAGLNADLVPLAKRYCQEEIRPHDIYEPPPYHLARLSLFIIPRTTLYFPVMLVTQIVFQANIILTIWIIIRKGFSALHTISGMFPPTLFYIPTTIWTSFFPSEYFINISEALM